MISAHVQLVGIVIYYSVSVCHKWLLIYIVLDDMYFEYDLIWYCNPPSKIGCVICDQENLLADFRRLTGF